ncbi:hypothetical protein [Merdimmobilis hominis]|uniref:hypothetical protein n=1 Tax=Merdimmobilis hominis TaxID=2897707 RepID=UPI0011602267|nr:hypothetical protein [Merdimmobilis hominis]
MMKPSEQAREQVKALMGITYSDPIEDQKIEWQMESCMADMVGAGVPVELLETPLAVDSMALYCKMRQGSDTASIQNHPVYIANLSKLRSTEVDTNG